ncbi:hypothetical protein [Bacillus sp. FJAT-45350]|nr:hypothetical protein [Bacillus sp. FJAT-45350]
MLENSIYEIGILLENYHEEEKVNSIGHNVFEISMMINDYKESNQQ